MRFNKSLLWVGLAMCLFLTGCDLTITSDPALTSSHTAAYKPSPTPKPLGIWGRLANPGFENERIKTSLFFAGQSRDGSSRYGCSASSNLDLYTVHPSDSRNKTWSQHVGNRDFVIDQMVSAGLNVVSMSTWGEDFLACDASWVPSAPMQTAPGAHNELFTAAVDKHLLIIPFIESRADWAFRDEFPYWSDGSLAPGTLSQIINLIDRYLKNPAHPEWADNWAQVYDRNLEPRYAVTIIHASSNRLKASDNQAFAAGFDLLAESVYQTTNVRIGFFIDTLPPNSNAPGKFKPSPEKTGSVLFQTNAILGIQSFIPEIWVSGSPSESKLIRWKEDYSRRWSKTGIPFLMDISPGYNASIVFPASIRYGFSVKWQDALTGMVTDYGEDGLAFNSWNGYTEGMAAVPSQEYGDQYYRWLQASCKLVDSK
jgi:hypothetical protein